MLKRLKFEWILTAKNHGEQDLFKVGKFIFLLFLVSTKAFAISQSSVPAQDRFWFGAEYLSWNFKNSPESIPLVTSGSLAAAIPGAMGQPGTHVVMVGKSINTGMHPGSRITLGHWWDDNRQNGIEASYFFLSEKNRKQNISTTGLPGSSNLAVPIFDVSGFTSGKSPGESVFVLPGPFSNSPGFAGTFALSVKNSLQGFQLNELLKLKEINHFRVDLLTGFEWLQFWEKLTFNVMTSGIPNSATAGQFFNSHDDFCTRNNFYGLNFGFRAKYDNSKFYGLISTKVSLGINNEYVNIQGKSSTSNGTLFFPVNSSSGRFMQGGIFAQPSNIGHYNRNIFAVVPELDLKLGYHLLKNLNIFAGYSFLFISNLIRSESLINRHINTTRTALADASRSSNSGIIARGPFKPNFAFHNSSFWGQGISCGLEINL